MNWDAPRPRRRKPGRQRKYSNHAIETAVTLGMVFHLSSRQNEGLLRSLFALMKLDNDVPDHTTISRRKAKLGKVPFYQDKQKTPLHILIDSSGLAAHAGQLRRAQKSRDYRVGNDAGSEKAGRGMVQVDCRSRGEGDEADGPVHHSRNRKTREGATKGAQGTQSPDRRTDSNPERTVVKFRVAKACLDAVVSPKK